MTDLLEDTRNRPVVFQTRAEPGQHRLRPHVRMLAGVTLVVAALAGAAGITFGGSALWSVLGGTSGSPTPLWLPPPRGVTAPQVDHTATVDRDRVAVVAPTTTKAPTTTTHHHHQSATHVPGADDPPSHEVTRHSVSTPTEQQQAPATQQTQAVTTESQREPEPGDDHHRGAGGGGPHGGGSSGHG